MDSFKVGGVFHLTKGTKCRILDIGEQAINIRIIGRRRVFTSAHIGIPLIVGGVPFRISEVKRHSCTLQLNQEVAKGMRKQQTAQIDKQFMEGNNDGREAKGILNYKSGSSTGKSMNLSGSHQSGKSMALFCPDSCPHLSVTESNQKAGEPHFCNKFSKPVKHEVHHPKLVKLNECI